MDPLRPGNFDRAWNDPPEFSYNDKPVNNPDDGDKAASKIKLNKRVEFPSSLSTKPPLNPSNAPPPIMGKLSDAGARPMMDSSVSLPPPPKLNSSSNNSSKIIKEDEESVDSVDVDVVVNNLEKALDKLDIDAKKKGDISKRIKMMKAKWNNFNQPLQTGMFKIADDLTNERSDSALKIQTQLMVNWPSLCNPWLVGIKQLIIASSSSSSAANTESQ